MASLNRVSLVGRLSAEPTRHETPSGAIVRFSVAVPRLGANGSGRAQRPVDFFTIVVFAKTAGAAALMGPVGKGSLVLVEGRLSTRDWQDATSVRRTAVEVVAPVHGVQFLARPAASPVEVR